MTMKFSAAISPWRIGVTVVCVLAGMAALAVLYFFDPAHNSFYPICPFHALTGLWCPGCGTLRALHQLTHGNFAAAWRFNPIVMLLLPAAFWLMTREAIRLGTGRRLPWVVTNPVFGWALAAGMIVFGIWRNLPVSR